MPSLSSQSISAIQASLDAATANPKSGLHGVVFVAVDKNGNELAKATSGTRAPDGEGGPMTPETVFWIASCTKMITGIAALQLVEQGKLSLDDPESTYKLAPELRDVKVLAEDGTLVERKGDITLRKLLSHTAGFGYEFMNHRIMKYGRSGGLGVPAAGFDVLQGDERDIVLQPLANQPDTMFEYGINIDWAGILVERASGLRLGAYFEKHIFAPLGLKHIAMFPTEEMRKHVATMAQRAADGTIAPRDHMYRRALAAQTKEEQDRIFHSGGAGAFARPSDYAQILATLLNAGTSPRTGAQILQPSTVDLMFTNQVPQWPDFARAPPGAPPPSKPEYMNPAPEFYPQEGNPPQGWGLTFMLTLAPGATGRGASTAWWAGISNQFWWCDREKGVAGMIAGQVLPFGDVPVLTQWLTCEKHVYDGLQA
ncbi:beta-lactamase/transpeptidase-like protein [Trichodelitschia bisporula]|uniref:Beta-lactamase/transpeptidase-like protein n=1 Tax=Trichodelitschia bisporula TaxID=703511 RepID=A0A6G1I3S0_9PEZI|nr:beta-lactamase/transpeptidase-like protein [Trichodelitschia bisporula]